MKHSLFSSEPFFWKKVKFKDCCVYQYDNYDLLPLKQTNKLKKKTEHDLAGIWNTRVLLAGTVWLQQEKHLICQKNE